MSCNCSPPSCGTATSFQGIQEVSILRGPWGDILLVFLAYSRKASFFRSNLTVLFRVEIRMQQEWSTYRLFFFFWILFYFLYSRFLLVIHFIHISVYMSVTISQFIPPPPPRRFPPLVSICLFSTSVSQFLPCRPVHLYHFSRFHIYVLIHDICFTLSDLLHSVWRSLDPSTSLQMTQFRSFFWLSNIPLYICTTSSLSIRLSMGI